MRRELTPEALPTETKELLALLDSCVDALWETNLQELGEKDVVYHNFSLVANAILARESTDG